MIRVSLVSLMFLPLFFLTACTTPGLKPGQEVEIGTQLFGEPDSTPDRFDIFTTYKIMPGDVLDLLFHFDISSEEEFILLPQDSIEVKFLDVQELNEVQAIRPDGFVTMPYIGDVKAEGFSPMSFQNFLRKKYAAILHDPELYVIVREYGGKIKELKESIRNSARGQSKLITVRNDGYATLPIVGEVYAAGKTIPEITETANKGYHTITKSVRVDLLLHQPAGTRICVLGAVNSPGFYPINRPLSILQALAMAGGQTNDAYLGNVIAIRKQGTKVKAKAFDISSVIHGEPGALQVFISANDIVYVPRSQISELAQIVGEISKAIAFRGWGVGMGYDMNND